MKRYVQAVVIVSGLFLGAAGASAQTIVDQSNPSSAGNISVSVGALSGPLGQSFTPTAAAFNYATFDLLNVNTASASTSYVTLFQGGTGTGTLLGTSNQATLTAGAAAASTEYDFTSPISLAPGNLYSLILNLAPGSASGTSVRTTGDTYSSGTLIYFGTVNASFGDTGFSEGLKTNVAAAPEPGTWTMMMLGFGGLGYAMRRRQKVGVRTRFA